MKKQQDYVTWTLEMKKIEFEEIDVTDPRHEEDRKFMRLNAKCEDEKRGPIPPQLFNDTDHVAVSKVFKSRLWGLVYSWYMILQITVHVLTYLLNISEEKTKFFYMKHYSGIHTPCPTVFGSIWHNF